MKVSVILTSYNHAKYLRQAIESILSQTFSDFELIIWDDASTDESWEIITSYNDPRIRAFRNAFNMHRGNINRGLEKAQGEYIAIHHSDDVWEPEKLEMQVAFLDAHPEFGAVFTWATIIDDEGNELTNTDHFYYKVFEQPNRSRYEWLNYFFYHGNALCHPSVLIRKQCYLDVGAYRYGLAQSADFDMWVRLSLKYEIYVIPQKLVRFRVHADESNASGSKPENLVRFYFEYLQILENYKSISCFQEFAKIFPEARKFERGGGEDLNFVLGMISVVASPYIFTTLFGLNLLFAAMQDEQRAQKVEKMYGFTQKDFIILTGQHDVFSVGKFIEYSTKITHLNQVLSERDAQIAQLTQTLTEIHNSKTWRVALFLRKTLEMIAPRGSKREDVIRKTLSLLQSLYSNFQKSK